MSGYSRVPKVLKGALIQFSSPMLIPIPNLIVFQYNPETLTRTLKPWAPPDPDAATAAAQSPQTREQQAGRVQPYDPQEDFTVVLELDAADALEFPDSHPVAVLAGVADRIAAIEMLLYPAKDGALAGLLGGSVSVSIGAGGISVGLSAKAAIAASPEVPVVLFFWGPGRIVPVRITSMSIEEQAYSPLLYPVRAKVSLGMRVLTPDAFKDNVPNLAVKIAKTAYTFTKVQKEVLAQLNIANSVESIANLMPF